MRKNKNVAQITISIIALSLMIASTGCDQNKVIDDYPTAIENVDEMLVIDEEVPEEEISDALEWDLEKYSNANGNSLKETGTYVFDPTAIPLAYLNANEKYPEKIAFIRLALQSIYEGRKELIIPDELHLGKLEVDLFLQQIQDCMSFQRHLKMFLSRVPLFSNT